MPDKSHVATSCHTNPELLELQARAQAHTCQRRSAKRTRVRHAAIRYLHATHTWVRTRPIRYAFHSMILGITISILSIGSIPLTEPTPPQPDQSVRINSAWSADQPRPLTGAGTLSVGVRPRPAPSGEVHLPTDDALFAMSTRSDWSGRSVLPSFTTSIAVDSANLRTGPGILFDKVATLSQNEAVTVTAQAESWLLIQTATNQTAWIAADLVDLPVDVLAMIPPAASIPMPPPPLIAQTTVSALNMRDGPGTGYLRMTRLDVGTSVDLLGRFGTWLQVQTADGMQGWVDTTYLSMQSGVIDRVPATSDIPPMDPALRGSVAETGINLRSGPGTTYPSLGKLTTGTSLSLLARYDTWYKVQTPDATTGWVASDLLVVSGFIHRRIPITNDIPSLPIAAATLPKTVPSNDSAWIWPTTGRLTSPFGWRVLRGLQNFHNGIDIANQAGTLIVAARSGTIIQAGWCSGYGYCVIIDHGDGFQTEYGHMLTSPPVASGQSVRAGQLIGYMGSTYDRAGGGYSTGNHLHMTLRRNGTAVNPYRYLP